MKLVRLTILGLAAVALFAQARFDYLVRNDFFAGMSGNSEALKRAMETTEKVLAENPNHAEALVWHGTGNLFLSGAEFQKGNIDKGMEIFTKALAEMDRAVELAPNDLGVRIPHGAALMAAARNMPDNPLRRGLFERARDDFQHTYDIQEKAGVLPTIGSHPLGELLQNLGESYSRLGDADQAAKYYAMLQAKLPTTVYAKRADEWMKTRQPLPAAQSTCVGCHTSSK